MLTVYIDILRHTNIKLPVNLWSSSVIARSLAEGYLVMEDSRCTRRDRVRIPLALHVELQQNIEHSTSSFKKNQQFRACSNSTVFSG